MNPKVKELIERVRLTPEKKDAIRLEWYGNKGSGEVRLYSDLIDMAAQAQLNKVLNDKDVDEGLKLLQKVRQGMTIEAIIIEKRKRPDMVISAFICLRAAD